MIQADIKSEVIALARSPILPACDADALAALLVEEIDATPHLEPHVCEALIKTAVALVEHGHNSAAAESETAGLIDRMMSGDGAPHE